MNQFKYFNQGQLIARRDSIQKQLATYYEKLTYWEEQKAQSGLNTSFEILNGIKEARTEIEKKETELELVLSQLVQIQQTGQAKEESSGQRVDETENKPEVDNSTSEPISVEAQVTSPPDLTYQEAAAESIPAQHLASLKEALSRQSLALFIGADLPKTVTNLPSRTDLARALARRYHVDEALPLSEVTERVGQGGYRHEFTAFLIDALQTQKPTAFYQKVAEFVQQYSLETIITTAYDNALERAIEGRGVSLNRVIRDGDERYVTQANPTLIKLYGDLQQRDTLVVTASDHAGLFRNRLKSAILDEVSFVFRRNTMLFLGYNLSDPDFRSLLAELTEARRNTRPIFTVWPGLAAAEKSVWQDRGVTILEANPIPLLCQE